MPFAEAHSDAISYEVRGGTAIAKTDRSLSLAALSA